MSGINITVKLSDQRLTVFHGDSLLDEYSISTAKNGAGERRDSECTPRGRHIIRAKIGERAPVGAVFVGRRPTGEICTQDMVRDNPGRDWILTRILWLSGIEPGVNRLGDVDTMRRYIYIHGCPDSCSMGEPGSRGCIRMRNQDVIDLFAKVKAGTRVNIIE
ncbi:MAG: L,D-transpeptidase [Gammaproteobacteria bacterium]|nr:L,D-transpeptidase [Gammaproteobacteria bacterium]